MHLRHVRTPCQAAAESVFASALYLMPPVRRRQVGSCARAEPGAAGAPPPGRILRPRRGRCRRCAAAGLDPAPAPRPVPLVRRRRAGSCARAEAGAAGTPPLGRILRPRRGRCRQCAATGPLLHRARLAD